MRIIAHKSPTYSELNTWSVVISRTVILLSEMNLLHEYWDLHITNASNKPNPIGQTIFFTGKKYRIT